MELPDVFGDNELVAALCMGIQWGDYSVERSWTLQYGAYQRNYPGFMVVQPVHLRFIHDNQGRIIEYFRKWRHAVVDEWGYYGLAADFKKMVKASYHNTEFVHEPINGKWEMSGCWPTTFPRLKADHASNGVAYIDIVLSADTINFKS